MYHLFFMKVFALRLPWRNSLSISFHNRAPPFLLSPIRADGQLQPVADVATTGCLGSFVGEMVIGLRAQRFNGRKGGDITSGCSNNILQDMSNLKVTFVNLIASLFTRPSKDWRYPGIDDFCA